MTSSIEGVTGYSSTALQKQYSTAKILLNTDFNTGLATLKYNSTTNQGPTNAQDGNQVKISGITSYTAGSYVAIRMRYNRAQPLKMYQNTSIKTAKEIYTDDGTLVTSLQKNTWYTFVFYVESDTSIGNYSGNFFVDDWNKDLNINYAEIYVVENETAYETFKAWKGWTAQA